MPRRTTIYLLAIIVLALAVRVVWIDRQSFSMDEVNELVIAHKPVAEVIWVPDRMPPGYSLILKSVLTLFGSDSAGRWLSVGFGVLSIVGVWGVGRELVDERVGLAAAIITTLLPLHIFYSQYVRVYSFMFFLAAFGLWLLLLALRSQESQRTNQIRHWVGFTAICLLGIYSHYLFAMFIVVSMAVVIAKRRNIWMGRDAAMVCACIALGSAPLYWLLQTDFHLQNSATKVSQLDFASAAYTYFSFFSGYSLGPSRPELHTMAVGEAFKTAAPWAGAIAVCVAILGWEGYLELRRRRIFPVLLTILIGPVLLVGILSYATGVSYHLRYVVWCMIPIAIWLGAGLVRGWPKIRVRLVAAALIASAACSVFNHNLVPRYQTEDMRSAVATLEAESAANVPVFVLSDYIAIVVRYYLHDDCSHNERPVIELPRQGGNRQSVDSENDVADALTAISNGTQESNKFWLVYSREFHGDPQGLLLKDLIDRKVLHLKREFAGVQLYRGVKQ